MRVCEECKTNSDYDLIETEDGTCYTCGYTVIEQEEISPTDYDHDLYYKSVSSDIGSQDDFDTYIQPYTRNET